MKNSSDTVSIYIPRRGFTILEMLIVVSLIALLVGLTAMVGTAVLNSGRKQATLGVIQSLDDALAAYIDKKGDNPPALVEIPNIELPSSVQSDVGNLSAFYPAIDGYGAQVGDSDIKAVNSVGLFIKSASVVPQVQELIRGINPKFVRIYSADEEVQPALLTAFDAWGNPIRFVHPKFDGIIERVRRDLGNPGEPLNIVNPNKPFFVRGAVPDDLKRVRMMWVRRNRLIKEDRENTGGGGQTGGLFLFIPDSDGGKTIGNRPYFYSAGPDGDPSTLEDNVYSSTPQYADPGVN